MKTICSPSEMQAVSQLEKRNGKRIGLVPTMGYLHEGHMSLVRIARSISDTVILSLFVNPIQFGPGEDLSRYPRDFDRDSRLCESQGVDVLFCPPASGIYTADHSTFVEETGLSSVLCGKSRPGHFRGVATIVAKLFNLTRPDVAVFGQKDAQQLAVIRRITRDLGFPVEIVAGPIVREPDGLAMSSRNAYLSPEERTRAVCLSRALDLAARLYSEGITSTANIAGRMKELIREAGGDIDYVELVDNCTLHAVDRIEHPVLVALAVRIGRTRLIDNAVIGPRA